MRRGTIVFFSYHKLGNIAFTSGLNSANATEWAAFFFLIGRASFSHIFSENSVATKETKIVAQQNKHYIIKMKNSMVEMC